MLDDSGNLASWSLEITTIQCKATPTITAGATATRQRGTAGTTTTIATVNDAETPKQNLTVTVMSAPAGINLTGISAPNATTGEVTATVAADCTAALGNNTVVLKVTDGDNATATANFIVNVTANSPPTVGTYANTTLTPNGSTTVTPNAALADNGSIVSVTATASPNTFTGTFLGNRVTGAVTINNAGPLGTYTVTVTVADYEERTQQTFTLTVGEMPVLGAKVGDPAVCLDPGGWSATKPRCLPTYRRRGHLRRRCPGHLHHRRQWRQLSWNGLLPANTTVT